MVLRPLVRFAIAIYLKLELLVVQISPRFTFVRAKIGPLRGKTLPITKVLAAAINSSANGIGSQARGKLIVMLVVSDLRIDPRVERAARTLAQEGYHVRVVCPMPRGKFANHRLDWGEGVDFSFLHWSAAAFVTARPGYLAYAIFKEALRYRPFAFHAHDANVAYAGLAAARTVGAHLVVDFHEWFSENVEWDAGTKAYVPVTGDCQSRWRELEQRCLLEASAAITVCDSIADAMATELGRGRRPYVIRNIPKFDTEPTRHYAPLKLQLGIPEDRFVVLYQGGLGPTRYLEPIIRALAYESRFVFVVRGPDVDRFAPHYRSVVPAGAGKRLILAEGVPSRDVVAAARGADVGIWTLEALCRNFAYALPNKLFEYIAAGLPILAANYPESRKLVELYELGETFDPDDPRSIAAAIGALIDDPARTRRFAANTKTALSSLDAAAEWDKLVAIYDSLAPSAGLKV